MIIPALSASHSRCLILTTVVFLAVPIGGTAFYTGMARIPPRSVARAFSERISL